LLYPTAIWYPSTREAGPTTALQAAIGGMRTMADVELSVDAYYRTTSDLHGPVASSAPAVPHSNTGTPDIITGTGRLYGIELAVRRRSGNPTGSLRYVLARADQAFPSLNGGAWTRTPFDIRHQVHAAISVEPLAGWSAGMVAVLGSVDTRSKIGASTATMNSGANHDGSAIRNAFTNTLDLNGSLSPGFQRLELSLHRYFSVGKTLVRCSLRLVNGYGLLDPFRWEVTGAPAPADAWVADVERIALFPLYPVVSMNIRF
jgi:hypothetical protein